MLAVLGRSIIARGLVQSKSGEYSVGMGEVVAVGEDLGMETINETLLKYDEKLRAVYDGIPKIALQRVLVGTGFAFTAEVHDDFLPLVQLVQAEVATGLARMFVDATNEIIVKEGECFGYSPTMGGFVFLTLREKRAESIRKVEDWRQKDWEMVKGVAPELVQTLDKFLPFAEAMSGLAEKAAQNNPKYNTSDWRLLAGGD